MRILHTSDWHLGQMLYGYDRSDEFMDFFDQLEETILRYKPDALTVCGDIFDVSQPSAAVSRMFTDAVVRLHAARPEMTVIITSGNHDSSSRLDVDRNLWRLGGIHVLGTIARKEGQYDFDDNIIELPGKGFVAAIPFVNPVFMPKEEGKATGEVFFGKVAEAVSRCNTQGLPTVLMAHLTVRDCDARGHRRTVTGGIDAVGEEVLGRGFDYVALGHIHRPQEMGDGRIVYCGSPLAISFDEDYVHQVLIVDVEPGQAPVVERVAIEGKRALVDVPQEGADFKKALKILRKSNLRGEPYIRLNVKQKEDLPMDADMQVAQAAADKGYRLCPVKYERIAENLLVSQPLSMSVGEFAVQTPADIARRYLGASALDAETVERYLQMIRGLELELENEDGK